MKIEVPSGKYIAAVSGGVDSMVLLNLMKEIDNIEIIVAHFDHGIRKDSMLDKKFVEQISKKLNLVFVSKRGNLGAAASEESARKSRYEFLNATMEKYKADAIVTAHHQDDLIETAVINVLRGTGRKGLSALRSKDRLLRPMLDISKREILDYAKDRGITWREDPTNQDTKYLRNYVRLNITSKLDLDQRNKLLNIIQTSTMKNTAIDDILATLFEENQIDRKNFNKLSHSESKELIAGMLRKQGVYFDSKTLERLCVGLKTKPAGTKLDISGGWTFIVSKKQISLQLN